MNRIEKFLATLNADRLQQVAPLIARIEANDVSGLDVKKLKGRGDQYRIRAGSIRIIYVSTNKVNCILDIDWRKSNTY